MRIIAGEFKGRILTSFSGKGVRPATDRVKGSIFNILQNRLQLRGSHVLDLYAGSGSLGFEALSRGAEKALFVDTNQDSAIAITTNAHSLNCLDRCEIIQADALDFVQTCDRQFDLIFADPPYAYDRSKEIPGLIARHKLLKKEGFLIIEHSKHFRFDRIPELQPGIQREFGGTTVSFFVYAEREP